MKKKKKWGSPGPKSLNVISNTNLLDLTLFFNFIHYLYNYLNVAREKHIKKNSEISYLGLVCIIIKYFRTKIYILV
jgi:hypothetical protein